MGMTRFPQVDNSRVRKLMTIDAPLIDQIIKHSSGLQYTKIYEDLSGERACKRGFPVVHPVGLWSDQMASGCFFLSEFAGSYGGYEVLVVGGFGGTGREEKGVKGVVGLEMKARGLLLERRRGEEDGVAGAAGDWRRRGELSEGGRRGHGFIGEERMTKRGKWVRAALLLW
ncbi:hypothetical protein HAX54_030188 [Datura stramonium]|uniref:Uncharacterized protein n=1 Tax=Datura stramonium TaxID=4076 RepID=A0ABS8V7P3_DATST|nr:hypothetical protein [Datura stramonium]